MYALEISPALGYPTPTSHLHWDTQLPHPDRLVVRGGHKALPAVHKRDRVDSAKVVVVLLKAAAGFISEGCELKMGKFSVDNGD